MRVRLRRTFAAVLLPLCCAPATAAATWPAPWSVNAHAPRTPDAARLESTPPAPPARRTSVPAIFLLGAVRAYQVGISPADGASCSFSPTCSGYAVHALRKHGAVTGFVMTSERVMRNHAGPWYPRVQRFGVWRLHDPVEANDVWLPSVRRAALAALEARREAALAQRARAGIRDAEAQE